MDTRRSLTDYLVATDSIDNSTAYLNFPPTEISRVPTDTYVEADEEKINTYLYPCDFPRRNYQFEISKECLKQNTLVCIPTGTGKTFIAAVVIMNFYRWYPDGIIIFCAPTRALVEQQISACNNFTLIPDEEVTIFTGSKKAAERKHIWNNYKVIYATPQIIEIELRKGHLDPTRVTLIVFDEAHHARSRHAYCMITRMVAERSSQFRVVGLTATPGKDVTSIQDVIYNLMISKVMYKDEDDPDIAQYQHNTDIEIVTVPLGGDETALSNLLNQSIEFLIQKVKTFLTVTDPNFLTKGMVFVSMQKLKNGEKGPGFFSKMNNFGLLMTLTTMKEKLQKYGPSFLDKALKDFDKKKQTHEKVALMNFNPFKTLKKMSTAAKRTDHPKLAKLSVILEDFFSKNTDSRCIIFTNYRDVAQDIAKHVKTIPNVKSSVFTGKGTTETDEGQNDKMQQTIVDLFRKGNINLIVATCIAEEGLDIGEVDLIICYDTQTSPLRTVQRMGRTGRKRAGRVIFLMAEGVEEKQLAKAVNKKKDVKALLTSSTMFVTYKPERPNMPIPDDIRCIKLSCGKKNAPPSPMTATKSKRKQTKPTLSDSEILELNAVNGKVMRFKKITMNMGKAAVGSKIKTRVFSHSAESLLLNSFALNYKEDIPESIDDEISKLFGEDDKDKEKDDSSDSYDEDSQPCLRPAEFKYERPKVEEITSPKEEKIRTFFDSDSSSESLIEHPKENLITNYFSDHPKNPSQPKKLTNFISNSFQKQPTVVTPNKVVDFISDTDNESTQPLDLQQKPAHSFSFLSDDSSSDSSDDEELERIIREAEMKSNFSSVEPEGIATKIVRQSSDVPQQQPKKREMSFLSSSDDDYTEQLTEGKQKAFSFLSDSE